MGQQNWWKAQVLKFQARKIGRNRDLGLTSILIFTNYGIKYVNHIFNHKIFLFLLKKISCFIWIKMYRKRSINIVHFWIKLKQTNTHNIFLLRETLHLWTISPRLGFLWEILQEQKIEIGNWKGEKPFRPCLASYISLLRNYKIIHILTKTIKM